MFVTIRSTANGDHPDPLAFSQSRSVYEDPSLPGVEGRKFGKIAQQHHRIIEPRVAHGLDEFFVFRVFGQEHGAIGIGIMPMRNAYYASWAGLGGMNRIGSQKA